MPVLSIDLACRNCQDIGVALMLEEGGHVDVRFLPVPLRGEPRPDMLAEYFVNLADDLKVSLLLVDGPQGWKSPFNGLVHSRVCERVLNTPAKTGLPGVVKPAAYTRFVEFSIAFFDQLAAKGWPRFDGDSRREYVVVESFPLAAWRSLELRALPAKARATSAILQETLERLLSIIPTRLGAKPNHDELQALVSGYAGLAMQNESFNDFSMVGEHPVMLDGLFREGFIVCPLRRGALSVSM